VSTAITASPAAAWACACNAPASTGGPEPHPADDVNAQDRFQIHASRKTLQLVDAMAANQLCERNHHSVGLGLETQEVLRLVQKGRGKVERGAHTLDGDSYACRCQSG